MNIWPISPRVYEINSWVWLNELGHRDGRVTGFGDVPEEDIERLAECGFDALWLMGVWQRSLPSLEAGRAHPDLCVAYRAALPDFTPDDVVGSPFAVHAYQVDDALGGEGGLASLRERMSRHGLRLILDFIPNHLACDHPWVTEYPERFVQGSPESIQRDPESYFRYAGGIFAHGRDPYFSAWTDTVQLDYRVLKTREAMTEQLLAVAERCDGLRCDMAMLVTRDIFLRTWGGAFDPPEGEFWSEAITKLRLRHSNFLMLAEVYWDKEFDLQQQGFDYTYDKRLYNHLMADDAGMVRLHMGGDAGFQGRLARFIENHDEPRALEAFGPQRSCAAAVAALGLPGLRLFHEGQLEGFRRRLPVQLRRRHCEAVDAGIKRFYRRLLSGLRDAVFQEGQWKLLNPHPAWQGNESHNNFVAYQWISGRERRLAVVNLSIAPSQCFLPLGDLGLESGPWLLEDLVGNARYIREGRDLLTRGLYLDMPAHGYHLFKVQPSQVQLDQVEPPKVPPGVRRKTVLKGHAAGFHGMAWSPDGRMLASAGDEKTIFLWDVEESQRICELEGHSDVVCAIAWSPDGRLIASGSNDHTVRLWDVASRTLHRILNHASHYNNVVTVAWSPDGRTLASGGIDRLINLWDVASGMLRQTLRGQTDTINCLAWSPNRKFLASGSGDRTVRLWELETGSFRILEGHDWVSSVAWSTDSALLASGTGGGTVDIWDAETGSHLAICEGHTRRVLGVAFSPDGLLLTSKSADGTIKFWQYGHWALLGTIYEHGEYLSGLAYQSNRAILATRDDKENTITIWDVEPDCMSESFLPQATVHHTTGKIILVGRHSVGKTALGYRMIHGRFKEQAATHGQHFWVFPALGRQRPDGTECEAILWDFAGQPDYRLVNALFLDDADLALVLFDASNILDPLDGVEFWLNQLGDCPAILVAAQTDRGTCALMPEDLAAFCRKHGIEGPIQTSAYTGDGVAQLMDQMKSMIPWERKSTTVTTTTFKRIKDYILGLKETESDSRGIVTHEELRRRLELSDAGRDFTDAELLTAVGHLENYGYVRRLRTSRGDDRVLLKPELLNNLASSFVLEARNNPKGLGSLEERRLLTGGYPFPELQNMTEDERTVLLDSAVLLFLKHNVCFRETDPLCKETYLIFPELINLKKPVEESSPTEDGVAYTVTGAIENVFASLVVLLGYTHTFTRTSQWLHNARYEVGGDLVCGFRQEAECDSELNLVLCFSPQVGQPVRILFQGLFESFLARRNLTVLRYEPIRCVNPTCGHVKKRSVVRQLMNERNTFTFCDRCGQKLALPRQEEPIQLTREVRTEVEAQRNAAEQRTRFEQAVFRVQAIVRELEIKPPECFISYAWGEPRHERWVEKQLATDLQNAKIGVVLDKWHNRQIGSSVLRFVERALSCDRVIVVGTPLYQRKYRNGDPLGGFVVAAEGDLIGNRLIGTEEDKRSVLPVLLEGTSETSFPVFLQGRVYADFRDEAAYFNTVFDLILSLYQLSPADPAVDEAHELLVGRTH